MAYLIAGIFVAFCAVVLFFAMRIYKENRKMAAEQKSLLEKEEDDTPARP